MRINWTLSYFFPDNSGIKHKQPNRHYEKDTVEFGTVLRSIGKLFRVRLEGEKKKERYSIYIKTKQINILILSFF